MQVIIDHDYLGPLCLQFSGSPTVADVKSDITERTGLPIKEQLLHRNGKKVSNLEMIFHFLSISLKFVLLSHVIHEFLYVLTEAFKISYGSLYTSCNTIMGGT